MHHSDRSSLSGLQTDAIDNHRSFSDKHGLTGKRELQLEAEEGRLGKAWVPNVHAIIPRTSRCMRAYGGDTHHPPPPVIA